MLGYGCIFQGGFIYYIDDTTNKGQTGTCVNPPCAGSIGGKISATADTYPGQGELIPVTPNWGSDGIDIGANLYETSVQGENKEI